MSSTAQKTYFYYNDRDSIEDKYEIDDEFMQTYNLWLDFSNFADEDLIELEEKFSLDKKAIDRVKQKSIKPVVIEISEDSKFTVLLEIKFNGFRHLESIPIYFFIGPKWLLTLHSNEIDLATKVKAIFANRKTILGSSVDALYYSIISNVIESYEQLLTVTEIKVFDIEKQAQYKPSKRVLEKLDTVSRQAITLRRHFWEARNVINYHVNMEKDKDDIKYLQIVYNNINQLIEMIQSYQDTINSTREIFSNSISLQINDIMRVLTIFSAIVLPLSLLISVLGLQGFDLNNLTTIPKYLVYLVVVMLGTTMITLFVFWRKQWVFSRDGENELGRQ